jgi:hypothetical protein
MTRLAPTPSRYRNGCCSARDPCPKHREIKAKYRRARPPYELNGDRLDELDRLAHSRYGDTLPEGEEGEDFAFVVANHIGEPNRIRAYLAEAAPWYAEDDTDDLIKRVATNRYSWRADTIASKKWLNVSYAEREELGLRTIGAYDMPKRERDKLRRQRYRQRQRENDRAYQERRRRTEGAKPRAQYEAESLSRTKPWLAAGVSRSTWYRNRETSASIPYTVYKRTRRTCATPATPRKPRPLKPPALSKRKRRRAVRGRRSPKITASPRRSRGPYGNTSNTLNASLADARLAAAAMLALSNILGRREVSNG